MKGRILVFTVCWLLIIGSFASARTLTVGASGQFETIQAAIKDASSGDVIQVAAGTYQESLLIAKSGVDIVGAGTESTIIESPGPVVTVFLARNSRIAGFTLRQTGSEPWPTVLMIAASTQLVNNVITGATLAGVEINGGNPALVDNHIHSNEASGVLVHGPANVELTGNVIEKNGIGGQFAGVEVREEAQASLQFNRIWLNGGSGVFAHQRAQLQLLGNSLIGNGFHGVSVLDGAGAVLVSNSFWWNTQVGVRIKEGNSVTVAGNFIANNPLGLLLEGQVIALSRGINLFLQNSRDIGGSSISSQEGLLNANALIHPQTGTLLQTLVQLGALVQQLRGEGVEADTQGLVGMAQTLELIGADVYFVTGLGEEAKTRLNLVIRMDPNSAAADQAREKLQALG